MSYQDRTKKLPEYCWKCGTKLTHTKYSCRFDEMTGEEKLGTKVMCPKSLFFAHYLVKFDESNNEVIEHPDL